MAASASFLLDFASPCFVFLVGEFMEWLTLKHDEAGWHYRFRRVKGYRNLNPIIPTWKAASVFFVMILFISPFILPNIWERYVAGLLASSRNWILLIPLFVVFSFLWIWHHMIGKAWHGPQYLLVIISILLLAGYAYSNVI